MSVLGCPIDRLALARDGSRFVCPRGHSYDVAREGHVNLLPPGRPSRKNAGDDKESIAARRRFLATGAYAPLATAIAAAVAATGGATIVDVGCGEGYYTAQLQGTEVVGVDISAAGVKTAARAYPRAMFAIGNALALPVVDGSCDVAVSVFAPIDADEFARVVTSDGHAVIAIPGATHLAGLRARLYQEPLPHDEALPLDGDERFRMIDVRRVEGSVTFDDRSLLHDVLTMTPYRFSVPPDAWERARNAALPLSTPIEFVVATFRRMQP